MNTNTSTDDDDMGAFWRDVKHASQIKRESNRERSAKALFEAKIPFISNNGGAHLIIAQAHQTIDFWPGTGLWKIRGASRQIRGVASLIKKCTEVKK